MLGKLLAPLLAEAEASSINIIYTYGSGDKFNLQKYQVMPLESAILFINKENGNIHFVNLSNVKKIIILPKKRRREKNESKSRA